MIEIDLLPASLRGKSRPVLNFNLAVKTKLVLTILGCIVLFHLLLQALSVISNKRVDILKRNLEGMSSEKAQIDRLKDELSLLNSKIPLIERLIQNRVIWSKKLNKISDLLVDGIWLTEIGLKGQDEKGKGGIADCLVIQGSAASQTRDEPALIGRFMQSLKDDPDFSGDFTDIELGPITKRLIAQTEAMDFILICRFRPERLKGLLQ